MVHTLMAYMLMRMEFMLGSNVGHECMTITSFSVYLFTFDAISISYVPRKDDGEKVTLVVN